MDRLPVFRVSWAPRPMDSAAFGVLSFFMDIRFLVGAVLGWKVLAQMLSGHDRAARSRRCLSKSKGFSEAEPATEEECARLAAELADTRQRLGEAQAAARQAERRLQEAQEGGTQREFTVLALEPEGGGQLEEEVAALREQLRSSVARAAQDTLAAAAENERLVRQNEEALQQLRGLAGAMEQAAAAAAQRQAEAADEAAARQGEAGAEGRRQRQERQQEQEGGSEPGEQPAGGNGELRLRVELEEARAQLAAALAENAELEERLLQVAFESLSPTSPPAAAPAAFSPPRGGMPLSADGEFQRIASASHSLHRELLEAASGLPKPQGSARASSMPAAEAGATQDAVAGQPAAGGGGIGLSSAVLPKPRPQKEQQQQQQVEQQKPAAGAKSKGRKRR